MITKKCFMFCLGEDRVRMHTIFISLSTSIILPKISMMSATYLISMGVNSSDDCVILFSWFATSAASSISKSSDAAI